MYFALVSQFHSRLLNSVLNVKALVGAFNQEKALVGAFSAIVQPVVEPMEHYTTLVQLCSCAAVPTLMVCAEREMVLSMVCWWGASWASCSWCSPTTVSLSSSGHDLGQAGVRGQWRQ